MPLAGRSHFGLLIALAIWIPVVFALAARWTHASRRGAVAALVGGLVAGAVNVGTDAAAHAAGFWRYTEATTPFGPLLYYVEAGIGCGALAIIARALRRRGRRAFWIFIGALGVYAPIRDGLTAASTHLIEFHYDPWPVVILADALSSFVVPVLVAYAVLTSLDPGEDARPA